jgi:hypothetical protein
MGKAERTGKPKENFIGDRETKIHAQMCLNNCNSPNGK